MQKSSIKEREFDEILIINKKILFD